MGKIEVMAVGKGHEDVPLGEDGEANGKKLTELLGKRYLLTVAVGEGEAKKDLKVTGFDPATNEIIAEEEVKEKKETRIAATTATVTASAPIAGG